MTEKLKPPCPFCKSKHVRTIVNSSGWCFVRCQKCRSAGPEMDSVKGAEDAWNKRTEIDYIEYIEQREAKVAKLRADEKKKKKASGK